jgi:hypothetical protein
MCRPTWFELSYEIKTFMAGLQGQVDRQLAEQQWETLYAAIESTGTQIELIDPTPQPDFVFTANPKSTPRPCGNISRGSAVFRRQYGAAWRHRDLSTVSTQLCRQGSKCRIQAGTHQSIRVLKSGGFGKMLDTPSK